MTANGAAATCDKRKDETCESVISRLQQLAERVPRNWAARYRLGICYSGRCQTHTLVSPDLAVEHLRSARQILRGQTDASKRAAVLTLLGLMYPYSSGLPSKARLHAAVECYEEAAAIYLERGKLAEWARVQFNLGNAWFDMPDGECPTKWEKAIDHYEQALTVRTKYADSHSCAATLQNLGTVYRLRTEGDKQQNVKKAINCYRRALHLCTVRVAPGCWAALHNNLGTACLSLPFTQTARAVSQARHAIRHFDLALAVRLPERSLFDYAVTKLNRAQACLQFGLCGFPAWLAEAVQCSREAHAAFLRASAPSAEALAKKSANLASRAEHWLHEQQSTANPSL